MFWAMTWIRVPTYIHHRCTVWTELLTVLQILTCSIIIIIIACWYTLAVTGYKVYKMTVSWQLPASSVCNLSHHQSAESHSHLWIVDCTQSLLAVAAAEDWDFSKIALEFLNNAMEKTKWTTVYPSSMSLHRTVGSIDGTTLGRHRHCHCRWRCVRWILSLTWRCVRWIVSLTFTTSLIITLRRTCVRSYLTLGLAISTVCQQVIDIHYVMWRLISYIYWAVTHGCRPVRCISSAYKQSDKIFTQTAQHCLP